MAIFKKDVDHAPAKIAITVTSVICVVVAFIIIFNFIIIPDGKYNNAIELMNEGKYTEAISVFENLEGYKDSTDKIIECNTAILDIKYDNAVALMNEKKYTDAISVFTELNGYKDSADKIAQCNNGILDTKYDSAVALMNEKKYTEAISVFSELEGYKDSTDKINECNINIYGEEVWNKIKNINVGDTYKLGSYEQDNNLSNGKEDIEWLVLSKEGTKILVISKYALDCKQFNPSYVKVTWDKCALRQWLNNAFLDSAFSDNEKEKIPLTDVSADINPEFNTNAGNATQDKVFLLSITEAEKYLASDDLRKCNATAYAISNGVFSNNTDKNCWWWLRSPGSGQYHDASGVTSDGVVDRYGTSVNSSSRAVRPAIWIDIS